MQSCGPFGPNLSLDALVHQVEKEHWLHSWPAHSIMFSHLEDKVDTGFDTHTHTG